MHNDKRFRSLVFFSGSGCMLPFLITFNLLFGWIFLKPKPWLITETILLLLFIINGYMTMRKISSGSAKRDGAIDVKGEVVEDRRKLK